MSLFIVYYFVCICVFRVFCFFWVFLCSIFPSVLWYCWLGLLTCKSCLPYNQYTVLAGTLNPAQSNLLKFSRTFCRDGSGKATFQSELMTNIGVKGVTESPVCRSYVVPDETAKSSCASVFVDLSMRQSSSTVLENYWKSSEGLCVSATCWRIHAAVRGLRGGARGSSQVGGWVGDRGIGRWHKGEWPVTRRSGQWRCGEWSRGQGWGAKG